MTTFTGSVAPSEVFPVPLEPRTRRLESIDILRGLLMVLMAIDHTRDSFSNVQIDPVDPHHSWPALFITRWITHLCAPGFIALAGASVYLQLKRGKTFPQLTRLLITRGFWFVFVDWVVISFGTSFGWAPFLQVIWAIGVSMVCLGVVLSLRPPAWAVGLLGASILTLHNLLDPIHAAAFGNVSDLWLIVHEQGFLTLGGHPIARLYYPVLAWFGVMCAGYGGFGPLATLAPRLRRRIAITLAICFATTFSLLRYFHGYGDPFRFEVLETPARTAMSFMDVQKYPPSLHYVLATFSVLLMLYAAFDFAASHNWVPRVRAFFETYGRVPFFYYVLHFYILHTLMVLSMMAVHADWHVAIGKNANWLDAGDPHWGYALPVVYALWAGVVLSLYRPCVWFAGVKAKRRDWWLSYL